MKIYTRLVRNGVLPITDFIGGTKIHFYLKFLEKSQWWSKGELQEYQNKKLRGLIRHAYEKVPYYHHEWKKLNLKPEEIKTVEDLRKIPIITKEDIRKNFDDFKSKDFVIRKPKPNATGGSTGEPLKFFHDWDAWSIDWACGYRGWGYADYNIGDKIVTIGGSSVVPTQKRPFKKWIKDKILERQMMLSAFDMGEANMKRYCEKITEYKPRFLRGYASSLYILARFVNEHNMPIPPVQGAFTTAETLYDTYRKEIEDAFNCEVFDGYSCRDGGGNAMECSAHAGLHISVERSVMEFVRGNENVNANEMGKIILTDLHNYSFPFIRYDVGDVGTLTDEKCSCGRKLPLIKSIEGRTTDIIQFSNGTIWSGPVLTLLFKEFDILQYQMLQEKRDHIIVKIVKGQKYTDNDEKELIGVLRYHAGNEVKLDIKYVDDIPPTKSGKRRFIISKVELKL